MGNTSPRTYPLSPSQTRIFLEGSLPGADRGLNIGQVVCRTTEELDLSAFRQAWQELARSRPELCVGFRRDDQQRPEQHVLWPLEVPIFTEDRDEALPGEKETFLARWLEQDRTNNFRFAHPPLMRAAAFRFADRTTVWVWTFHRILVDDRSVYLVLEDFFALYEAAVSARMVQLSARPPVSDFIAWQRSWLESNREAAAAFWHGLYSDEEIEPVLSIKARSTSADYRQEKFELDPDASTLAAVDRGARQMGVSIRTIIETTWALLLGVYYASDSVTFGSIHECRAGSVEGAGGMLGVLANFLPIHAKIPRGITGAALSRQIAAQQLAVRDYQWTPLDLVRSRLPVAANQQLGESCIFFRQRQLTDELAERFGKNGARVFSLREKVNIPLLLTVNEEPGLRLELSCQSDLFDKEDIRQMGRSFLALLRSVLANPNAPAESLELMDAQDRTDTLRAATGPIEKFPEEKGLHEWFEEQARKTPQAKAIIAECTLTYEQLDGRANILARRLLRSGAGPDRLVVIFLPRSAAALVGILATLKCGAAYFPIDPKFPPARVSQLLDDGQVRIVLTEAGFQSFLPDAAAEVIAVDVLSEATADEPEAALPDFNGAQLAYVLATSGTTGQPKLIGVEHRQTSNYLQYVTTALLDPVDFACVPHIEPLGFDASVYEIFVTLAFGGTLVALEEISDFGRSSFYGKFNSVITTPSVMATILKGCEVPPAMGYVGLGAETTPVELIEKLHRQPQVKRFLNYYGPTETTIFCTTESIFDRSRTESMAEIRSRGRAIGRPIANTRIYLTDKFGRLVPRGALGEIRIAGACVARGYLKADAEAMRKFEADPFVAGGRLYRSGDMARLLPDGRLEFHGRKDHQLKINGIRIETGEIENALLAVPGVIQALVAAEMGGNGRKRLVAYLVAREKMTKQKLRGALRSRLSEAVIPHHFVFLETMPMTPNGKIDRAALSSLELGPKDSGSSDRPLTPIEKKMQEIWEKNLSRSPIGLDQDYFEMGGDSLSGANLLVAIEKEFGVRLKSHVLLENSTIADLIRVTNGAKQAPEAADKTPAASFVCLQEAGDGVPLILLPGGTGTSFLNYKNFAMNFAPDHPVHAFQSAFTLMLEKRPEPLAYIADFIAREVVTLVKGRPFVLFGHCIGGNLAWHVAQLLARRNAPPFRLVAYDLQAGQKDISAARESNEPPPRSRLQALVKAYQPAWEQWRLEYDAGLRAKAGFALWMVSNFMARRGWLRSDASRVQYVKFSYLHLVRDSPLPILPGDGVLIFHHDQRKAVSESRWDSICAGETRFEFIPGEHGVWQTAIFNIVPLVRAELEKAGDLEAPPVEPALTG